MAGPACGWGTRPPTPGVGHRRAGPVRAFAPRPPPQRDRPAGRLGHLLGDADSGGLADLDHVGFPPLVQADQEIRHIAIATIGRDRAVGHALRVPAHRCRLVQQRQGQLRLGGEGQPSGDARRGGRRP